MNEKELIYKGAVKIYCAGMTSSRDRMIPTVMVEQAVKIAIAIYKEAAKATEPRP